MVSRRWRWLSSVHLPFAIVLLICFAAVVRVLESHWRQGAYLLGGALLVAAAFRALLPEDRVGLIAIRRRAMDIVLYSTLGLAILLVAVTIAGGPLSPVSS